MIKILLVDDSKTAIEMLMAILKEEPEMEVIGTASNGNEAISFLKSSKVKPDVIVLDIKMPVMDGAEALEHIMSFQPTPILVVSELKKEEIALTARNYGINDIIQKPSINAQENLSEIGQEIIERIKKLAEGNVVI